MLTWVESSTDRICLAGNRRVGCKVVGRVDHVSRLRHADPALSAQRAFRHHCESFCMRELEVTGTWHRGDLGDMVLPPGEPMSVFVCVICDVANFNVESRLSVFCLFSRQSHLGNQSNNGHRIWHGDCIGYENALRVNYIHLDLH